MPSTNDSFDPEFVRSVLAASEDCIKVLSLDGKLTFMSEGGMRVMEVGDFNAIRGCPWPDFWIGEGNADAKAAVAGAREGASARFVGMARTMLGNPRWWDVQVSPIFGADGKPERILSVSRDITELREASDRNHLLVLEMGHRMKNIFALVQAVIGQTLRASGSIEAARSAVAERLGALAHAQDLLTRSSFATAPLQGLFEASPTLAAVSSRVKLNGPEVDLPPSLALAMALGIHELATNAAKYGALSGDAGIVEIDWHRDGDAFGVTWRESGGPPVNPPSRVGFGSSLLQRAIAAYFEGETQLEFLPSGLVFTLRGSLPKEAGLAA